MLLAGPTADTVVATPTGDDWEADRAALVARDLSFADFLDRRGLVLRSDLLGAWARWITPEFEPTPLRHLVLRRRAAPRASAPATRRRRPTAPCGSGPPRRAEGYDRGELLMMPPTISTLRALQPYATVAEVLAGAAGQDLTPGTGPGTTGGRRAGAELAGPRRVHPAVSGRAAVGYDAVGYSAVVYNAVGYSAVGYSAVDYSAGDGR